jgi:hypothetical protein
LTFTPSSSDNPDEEDIPILVGRNMHENMLTEI